MSSHPLFCGPTIIHHLDLCLNITFLKLYLSPQLEVHIIHAVTPPLCFTGLYHNTLTDMTCLIVQCQPCILYSYSMVIGDTYVWDTYSDWLDHWESSCLLSVHHSPFGRRRKGENQRRATEFAGMKKAHPVQHQDACLLLVTDLPEVWDSFSYKHKRENTKWFVPGPLIFPLG